MLEPSLKEYYQDLLDEMHRTENRRASFRNRERQHDLPAAQKRQDEAAADRLGDIYAELRAAGVLDDAKFLTPAALELELKKR